LWKKAPPPQTKKESPSVQKTPAHRTGERAVLKERTCKGEKCSCGGVQASLNTPYSPKTACFASPAAPMIPASFPNSAMAIRHRSANSG